MPMKTKIAALLLAAAALLTNACEHHKWSETQKLFQEKKVAAKGAEAGKGEAQEH